MAGGERTSRGGRPLSPEQMARGRQIGVERHKQNALQRQAFVVAFAEASRDMLGEDAYELRKKLVARLCREALAGKQWALEKAMAYLFGHPRQEVSMHVSADGPPVIPEVPDELREQLRELRERMRSLRGEVIGSNGHSSE